MTFIYKAFYKRDDNYVQCQGEKEGKIQKIYLLGVLLDFKCRGT